MAEYWPATFLIICYFHDFCFRYKLSLHLFSTVSSRASTFSKSDYVSIICIIFDDGLSKLTGIAFPITGEYFVTCSHQENEDADYKVQEY